jgi:hypothetical protein
MRRPVPRFALSRPRGRAAIRNDRRRSTYPKLVMPKGPAGAERDQGYPTLDDLMSGNLDVETSYTRLPQGASQVRKLLLRCEIMPMAHFFLGFSTLGVVLSIVGSNGCRTRVAASTVYP